MPLSSWNFGTGTSSTPAPLGIKAKVWPASQCNSVRIALGMDIWYLEESFAVCVILIRSRHWRLKENPIGFCRIATFSDPPDPIGDIDASLGRN